MPKVLHKNGKCYEQVAPTSLYESDLELNLLLHAETLYPEHHVTTYKLVIRTDDGYSSIPDLVFIAKDYREWWLVEIEMEDHSLETHVLPQVQVFANGIYSESDVEYLLKKLPFLDVEQLRDLIINSPPRIMVIMNTEPKEVWFNELSRFSASIATFEVFRSDDEDEVFRLNGEHIAKFVETVTECFCESIYPNVLRVDAPERLGIKARGIIRIRYEEYITEWQRVDAQSKVWLVPTKRNPLPMNINNRYELFRHRDGSITLKISSVKR
jgi:hypothetical protein